MVQPKAVLEKSEQDLQDLILGDPIENESLRVESEDQKEKSQLAVREQELSRRRSELPPVTFESNLIYVQPEKAQVAVKVIRWGKDEKRIG